MKKNDVICLTITDMGVNGEGIGRSDGYAFFVKDALIGDTVEAVVTRLKTGYGFARVKQILVPSPERIVPPCPEAARCGGCQIMQLSYEEQLRFKEQKVRNDLERIGEQKDLLLRPIIGMDRGAAQEVPLHFRNKLQLPVGRAKDGRVITGFYAGRTHYIIETEDCPVAPPSAAAIMRAIRTFIEENGISVYDEESGKGLVRHVLLRYGFATGQIMVCLVLNGSRLKGSASKGKDAEKAFVERLHGLDLPGEKIASVCLNVNRERGNRILGEKTVCLDGTDYIEDRIGELIFRISPLSFFQVNSAQTRKLYGKALEYAALTGTETVWDLYCGTGTISLFLAQKAGKVYGVEIVPEAIEDAKVNAALNGIGNAEFICGKSEEVFPQMSRKMKEVPDVVVLDPPRKGCDSALLSAILEVAPSRIVYVSCDSATLARDVKILGSRYRLLEATPVDMFPHTGHVECVVLMTKK